MRLKPQEGGRFDESGLEYPECHKCVHDGKKSKACLRCRAKGTMLGVVRRGPAGYEGTEFLGESGGPVTSLPPDAEDRFRTALCELFQLRPVELLTLQGIMQRKTLTEIAESLTQTFGKYGGKSFTRFYVKEVRKAMASKMPELKAALLTAGQKKELRTRGDPDSRNFGPPPPGNPRKVGKLDDKQSSPRSW